jgi:hypothetical protein
MIVVDHCCNGLCGPTGHVDLVYTSSCDDDPDVVGSDFAHFSSGAAEVQHVRRAPQAPPLDEAENCVQLGTWPLVDPLAWLVWWHQRDGETGPRLDIMETDEWAED